MTLLTGFFKLMCYNYSYQQGPLLLELGESSLGSKSCVSWLSLVTWGMVCEKIRATLVRDAAITCPDINRGRCVNEMWWRQEERLDNKRRMGSGSGCPDLTVRIAPAGAGSYMDV